jgi:NMD protein affecting ribosome stability and mRNA decay
MRVLAKFIDYLIDRWLRLCPHDSAHVAADILEGGGNVQVKYCRRCGAVRPEYASEWRRPRPLWFST